MRAALQGQSKKTSICAALAAFHGRRDSRSLIVCRRSARVMSSIPCSHPIYKTYRATSPPMQHIHSNPRKAITHRISCFAKFTPLNRLQTFSATCVFHAPHEKHLSLMLSPPLTSRTRNNSTAPPSAPECKNPASLLAVPRVGFANTLAAPFTPSPPPRSPPT